MPPATPSRGLSEWVSHSHAASLGLDIRFLEANTQRRQHPMATPVRSLSTAVVLQAWQGPYRMRLQDGTELEAATGEGFFAPPLLQHQFFVLTVHEVATQCGFDSPEYFSRFFTKRTGLRPTAFRKATRDAKS